MAALIAFRSRFFHAGIRNGSAFVSVIDSPYCRQSWLEYSFAIRISWALW